MALTLLLAYMLFITPVKLTVLLRHDRVTDVTAVLRLWNIPRHFRWRSHRDRSGRHILRIPDRPDQPPKAATPGQEQRALILIGTFLRSDHARRFLLRHVSLVHARLALRIGLEDAAKTAALSGMAAGILRTIARKKPGRVSISVQPDFLAGHTRAHIRCILFCRLGTLLITSAMALIALMLEKREHAPSKTEEA